MRISSAARAMALLLLSAALLGALPAQAETIDAPGLVREMNKAVALIEKHLTAAGTQPSETRTRALYSALREATLAIDRLSNAVKSRSASFLTEIDQTDRHVERLNVAYGASGITNPAIASTMEKLRAATRALQNDYGAAAVRLRRGDPLSPAEQQGYAQLREQVEELRARIKDTQVKASQGVRDASFAQSMAGILVLLNAFDTRQPTLPSYVNALQSYRSAYDMWWANTSYWGTYYPRSAPLYTIAGPTWRECGTSYDGIVVSPSYTVNDWRYLEQNIELRESVEIDITDAELARYQSEVLDFHNDAKIDPILKDTDGDGIPDIKDPDIDNDGIPNVKDSDVNNDGIPDAVLPPAGEAPGNTSVPVEFDPPLVLPGGDGE